MTPATSWALVLGLLGVAAVGTIGASWVMAQLDAYSRVDDIYDWQREGDFADHKPLPVIGERRVAVGCTCRGYVHVEPIRLTDQQGAYDAALGAYWDEHGNPVRGAVA